MVFYLMSQCLLFCKLLLLLEWEGNDEWLRAQFRVYLEGMLAAVQADGGYI